MGQRISINKGFKGKDIGVDEKIREFAEFAKDNIPSHISCISLIITRDSYTVNAISDGRIDVDIDGELELKEIE